MRNIILVSLIGLIALLAIPIISHATYNDASIAKDVNFTVNGLTLTVTGSINSTSEGVIESITIDSGNMSVVLKPNSSIAIKSVDRRKFASSDNTVTLRECTSAYSLITLSMADADAESSRTVTVTPSSDTKCDDTPTTAVANTGSAAPGTISPISGGGSTVPPPTVVTATPPVTQQAVVPSAPAVSAVFVSVLKINTENDDVLRLQKLLNTDSATRIAEFGVGSPGNETNYFGSLTRKAVEKFQCKYGIVCSGTPSTTGYGLVGPSTRAKLAEVFAGVATGVAPQAQTQTQSGTAGAMFTSAVSFGKSHNDILLLQAFLNTDPDTRVAESGIGSQGNETDYFGSLTRRAVEKFQCKYDIVCSGTPATTGYGVLGPSTRAKLNEVFGK